jgi:hypothetical protein
MKTGYLLAEIVGGKGEGGGTEGQTPASLLPLVPESLSPLVPALFDPHFGVAGGYGAQSLLEQGFDFLHVRDQSAADDWQVCVDGAHALEHFGRDQRGQNLQRVYRRVAQLIRDRIHGARIEQKGALDAV